jgi:diguanylate cyclase (GGDEF)-like protein
VPIIAPSHFSIDLPTLFGVTAFVAATGGLLLLLAWVQNRHTAALALWGVGYIIAASGVALLALATPLSAAWTVCSANTLVCAAYGLMWAGARSFEGRHPHMPVAAAGAIIWIIAFQFAGFAQSATARLVLVSIVLATYSLLGAYEVWHARDRELRSRTPTLALLLLHSAFLLARIPLAHAVTLSVANGQPLAPIIPLMGFQALFTVFCLPFLRLAMFKERTELAHRRAALTDALTGVANRRGFFERGAHLLQKAAADGRPAALVLFDLDRFKDINDTAGHDTGDRVLKAFAELVTASLGPNDLFGRLGGEEFGCLLPNASMAHALKTAEHLRKTFAALRLSGLEASPSVSAGVAVANETGRDLPALLARADRALYRAKFEGRNRVASAPPVLVETGGGETPPRASRRPTPPVPAAL